MPEGYNSTGRASLAVGGGTEAAPVIVPLSLL